MAKANITLKLDVDLLREVKIMAAEEDTSISALARRTSGTNRSRTQDLRSGAKASIGPTARGDGFELDTSPLAG